MSYKPGKGGGAMLEKFKSKADKYRNELNILIPQCNPPKFEQINYLSKCFYLYYLNENKFIEKLTGSKKHTYSFNYYVPDYFLNIFKNNSSFIYKPILKLL